MCFQRSMCNIANATKQIARTRTPSSEKLASRPLYASSRGNSLLSSIALHTKYNDSSPLDLPEVIVPGSSKGYHHGWYRDFCHSMLGSSYQVVRYKDYNLA